MKPTLVVPLRAAPPLNDVAGSQYFGWGEIADRHGIAGFMMHAAQLALTDREV